MAQEKENYLSKMHEKINEWDAKIEELEAKANSAEGSTKQALNEQLAVLRQKRENVIAKYEEIKEASGESWDDIQHGLEHAAKDFQEALTHAFSKS